MEPGWPRHLSPHSAGRDPEKPSQGAGVRRRETRHPDRAGLAGREGLRSPAEAGRRLVAVGAVNTLPTWPWRSFFLSVSSSQLLSSVAHP